MHPMTPDLQDTIVALSSASGRGGRAIVRLSGPNAIKICFAFFRLTDQRSTSTHSPPSGENSPFGTQYPVPSTTIIRRRYEGFLHLPDFQPSMPASLLAWPGPKTYTSQNLAELHFLACPPVVDLLVSSLLNAGARAAQPGEFTLRAFLAGKIDLPRAEAVLGVIEARSRDDLKQALGQLAGGVTGPLEGLREDLLDLLAEVEAGLDFAEEDIRFVHPEELLKRLAHGLAQLTLLAKQLDKRSVSGDAFRVVLAGRPNAGKSSLFNALTGASALVSPEPGTTRDYLIRRILVEGIPIDLIDTAGWREQRSLIEEQAQGLGRKQTEQADLILLCLEAGLEIDEDENKLLARTEPPAVCGIATKCDLASEPRDRLATSAKTGAGLDALRDLLAEHARQRLSSSLAPSLSRCRHHVQAALEHLRRAHSIVLFQEPSELLALELRGTLDELGEMVGAVYTDDLLDRIFSRFCIGK
jgi:tRNA modification GTPase